MTLLWAVPVVAAAVGTLLVAARARSLEDEVVDLVADVRDLRVVREPLRSIRELTAETDALVEDFRDRHVFDDDPRSSPDAPAPAVEEQDNPEQV
ncbi:MAG TPA: hypothetical protein VFY82_00405 [Acidimicrobiales bacterium]|nr:hypothetical protein [Acidimicrobiales bacterium]